MTSFGERIKQLRKKNGFKQHDIAYAMEVERASYTNWELGKREPNFESLCKLADFYGVTTDYLLGRKLNINAIPNSDNMKLETALKRIECLKLENTELKAKLYDLLIGNKAK